MTFRVLTSKGEAEGFVDVEADFAEVEASTLRLYRNDGDFEVMVAAFNVGIWILFRPLDPASTSGGAG